MSSQESSISNFLNGKPSIERVEQSSLFSRLQQFLPKLEEANQQMPATASADAFNIEKVEEDSSDESSSSSDDDSDSEETPEAEETEKEFEKRIEIDLDVFAEQNSSVDQRDVSVQKVENLPDAFNSSSDTSPAKKPLIEEI
uniref:Ovule protein n=1 Tax=Caenorhabditis tropicalis TaxID=1561998 RepID=A0A1I7U689_9PELO